MKMLHTPVLSGAICYLKVEGLESNQGQAVSATITVVWGSGGGEDWINDLKKESWRIELDAFAVTRELGGMEKATVTAERKEVSSPSLTTTSRIALKSSNLPF